jgi:hypothetical protein
MNTHVASTTFTRPGIAQSENLDTVLKTVEAVKDILGSPTVQAAIAKAHVFSASSHKIQEVFLAEMLELGFSSEKKGLFSEYQVSGIRPDYFKALSGGGILFEVERGKTLANNMDLLDVWKTHICVEARHLFLMVPLERVNGNGGSTKIFKTVEKRIGAFFSEQLSPLEVDTVTIFGY